MTTDDQRPAPAHIGGLNLSLADDAPAPEVVRAIRLRWDTTKGYQRLMWHMRMFSDWRLVNLNLSDTRNAESCAAAFSFLCTLAYLLYLRHAHVC
jgi:hypothetical protein